MSDVFISYKREERSAAQALAAALEKEGWSVWWDLELVGGEHFDDAIQAELDKARCVIVLWSKLSVKSDFIKDEATYALNQGKLLPVFLEKVKAPFRFLRLHTIDLVDWGENRESELFRKLVDNIADKIERPPLAVQDEGHRRARDAATRKGWKPRTQTGKKEISRQIIWVAAAGVFLLMTGGLWFAWVQYQGWVERQKAEPIAGQDSETVGQFRRIYYEGFSALADPAKVQAEFQSIWLVGKKSDWEGRIENGVHTLCNVTGDTTASFTNRLRYYASKSDNTPTPLGDSKVTVKVRTEPPHTTHSGAGLRFRSVEGKTDYYAFVLNPGNSVSLLHRAGSSLRILWSGEVHPSPEKGFRTLKIIGQGTALHLYVNDELLYSAKKLDLLDGNPGIMAYSTGCFVFDDFAISQPLDEVAFVGAPDLTRVWSSSYGGIHLTRNGDTYEGWYAEENNTIRGTLSNQGGTWIFAGEWGRKDDPGNKGGFRFTFTSPTAFTGNWWYDSNPSSTTSWTGSL